MKSTIKSRGKKNAAKATRAGFSEPAVDAVFKAYPAPIRSKLLALRRLIFDTAKATRGVGALEETLKWGQPSYLTTETKSGSTIRIDQVNPPPANMPCISTVRPIWLRPSDNYIQRNSHSAATEASS
jgi:hypothetical protein